MNERAAVALAASAFLGALNPRPVPLTVAIAVTVIGVLSRRQLLVVMAIGLLCSSLAWRSWDGLEPGGTREVDGVATLVTDPVRAGRQTTAVIRMGETRYLASAFGGPGARLGQALAGERVRVAGTTRTYNGSRERRAALHVADRLGVDQVHAIDHGHPLWRVANAFRSRVQTGSESLGTSRQALFTGLVYGDDRYQDPMTEVDFRLVGLTHLLAVSGQNVAYTLTLLGPIIRTRSGLGRWIMTGGVLVVFAAITRFEPSVLRATVMAALAVTAQVTGRDAASARLLSMAVTALLIVDPLLAETAAFRLSVAASAGIVWLSPAISRVLGPGGQVKAILAVTLSAQLAVAPLLVTTFGPVSLVSIPANVVAGPIAGLVMGWGMTAGLLAGFTTPQISALIHQPTALALQILEGTAHVGATAPVAPVGLWWIAGAGALVVTRRLWTAHLAAGLLRTLIGLLLAAALIPGPVSGRYRVGYESDLVSGGEASRLHLRSEGDGVSLLVDLERLGVERIDIVDLETSRSRDVLAMIEARIDVGEVIARR